MNCALHGSQLGAVATLAARQTGPAGEAQAPARHTSMKTSATQGDTVEG